MPVFSPQEVYTVTDGQTEVALDHPYVIGSSGIMVFLNGILCVLNQDYTELDSQTIEFKYQLSSDDVVIVQHQVYFDDKNISVIGKAGSSLYQKYGTQVRLMENQKYTMRLQYGQQEFAVSFFTTINPLYSTLPIIQNDLGDALDGIEAHRILFLIYQNSILADNIASEDNITARDESVEAGTGIPYMFKQFVRYRTELDIMTAIYMALAGKQGTESKALGELKINRQKLFVSTDINYVLKELRGKLKEWERLLRGAALRSPLGTAVRAGSSSAYPLTSPRINFE